VLHVIIEPHPDVLSHMKSLGWYEKPGVEILEGKWQDFVDTEELLKGGGFDVVYTDTFSEDYEGDNSRSLPRIVHCSDLNATALHKFFQHLPDLLTGPEARFGFFNGLGATSKSPRIVSIPH
jgi:type IV protein arginine methyltransferase